MRSCWCLLAFLLLQESPASHGLDTHNMPPELAVRLIQAKLDGSNLRPIPITREVYDQLVKGPFPGDVCDDGFPCKVPFPAWYCSGMCRSLQTHCHLSEHSGNAFCKWCEDLGCFLTSVSTNTPDSDTDYFDLEYVDIAYQDPK